MLPRVAVFHVFHDPFMCDTHDTFMCDTHDPFMCDTHDSLIGVMMIHDSLPLIMSHVSFSHDSFATHTHMCMCDMTDSNMTP